MTTIIQPLDSHPHLYASDREKRTEDHSAPRAERNRDSTIRTHSASKEILSLQGLTHPSISPKQRDIQRQVCTPGLSSTKLLFLCEEEKSWMNSCNVATVFHRIAKNYKEDKRDLSSAEIAFLIEMYHNKIVDLNEQGIANTLWAMATLGIENPGLVTSLGCRAIDISSYFNEQNIANTLWAMATLGIENPGLFKSLSHRAIDISSSFKAQEIANTLWAMASLGIENPSLVNSLCRRAIDISSSFKAQEIANTLWAMASLGIENPGLVNSLCRRAIDISSSFNAQGIANTLWAMATLGIENPGLVASLGRHAIDISSSFNAQGIANTLWAMASLGIENLSLVTSLGRRAIDSSSSFNAQNIANTLWAMATLGIENHDLIDSLCRRAIDISSSFNAQEIANTLWAFALNKTQSNLTDNLVAQLFDRINMKKVNIAERDQLIFFLTHHQDRDYSEKNEAQRQECLHQLYQMIEKSSPSPSHTQRELYNWLRTNFPEGKWRLEYFSTSVGYHLDIVEKNQRINIEIDGPSHYLQSGNRRPTDQRLDDVKERNGWKVIRIDVREKSFEQIEEEIKAKINELTLRSQEMQAPKN
jgi:very-short-patch-repair endonuclease